MKKRRGHFWLDVTACFLIPAYTLLFAGSVEWFGSNFSVIAVRGENYYWGFVGWGLLTGGYFLVMLVRLVGSLPRRGAQAGVLLLTALGSLSLGYALIIPYLPDHFPRYATLHVLLAALACVLLMGALLVTLLALRREERGKWQGPFRTWWGIVAGSGILFFIPGMVSTALEVFFTISAALLTRHIYLRCPGRV